MTVTPEELRIKHRDYMREWRRRNPDREKQYHRNRDPAREREYRQNTRRRKYLAELLAERRPADGQSIAT